MFICPRAPAETQMLLLEKTIFHKYWLFGRDSSRLHLTFVAFCLMFFIRKQWLKQCNYSVDQSALLTGFRTDFTSSVWNFCRWVADVPPRETSSAAKSEEKRMFSQASVLDSVSRPSFKDRSALKELYDLSPDDLGWRFLEFLCLQQNSLYSAVRFANSEGI